MTTTFQKQVWERLQEIPEGRVTTYQEIARSLGAPRAMRAVGSACARNQELVTIPCHRVVCSDGQVGNYAKGTEQKIQILKKEGVEVQQNKIVDFADVFYRFAA